MRPVIDNSLKFLRIINSFILFSVCMSVLVSDRFDIIDFICKTCFLVLIISSVGVLIYFVKRVFQSLIEKDEGTNTQTCYSFYY